LDVREKRIIEEVYTAQKRKRKKTQTAEGVVAVSLTFCEPQVKSSYYSPNFIETEPASITTPRSY
jgi:hypothetical protein